MKRNALVAGLSLVFYILCVLPVCAGTIENASAQFSNGRVTVSGTLSDPVAGQQITLMITPANNLEKILYIDQVGVTPTAGNFSIPSFPLELEAGVTPEQLTVRIGGSNIPAPAAAPLSAITIEPETGYFISGEVQTYNPKNPTTVKLLNNGAVVDTYTIEAVNESGQKTQSFKFINLKDGTYSIEVTKQTHTKYTINGIKVEGGNAELSKSANPLVKLITLIAGDVETDGNVNVTDLNKVWSSANYGKEAANIAAKECDINGDGSINVTDLNIVWSSANYGKGEIVVNLN